MTVPFDLAETDRLLSTTRAVRRRLDLEGPVEREVLLESIGLSQQAPPPGHPRGLVITSLLGRAAKSPLILPIRRRSTQREVVSVASRHPRKTSEKST